MGNEGATNNNGKAQHEFKTPNNTISQNGLRTIQINAAREMYQRTVRARDPRASSSTRLNNNSIPTISSTTTTTTTASRSHFKSSTPIRHICNNPNNPPCANCGTTIIPSPKATYPLEDSPSITVHDHWVISATKRPILNSTEFQDWEENKLPGLTLPEMIFGNSTLKVTNNQYDYSIEFNTLDALKLVKLNDSGIRVSYSNNWIKSKVTRRNNLTTELISESYTDDSLNINAKFDWTYTTDYKGTEKASSTNNDKLTLDNNVELPIDKLTRQDPIIFFDDMILFEDELADNGISIYNVKIRVMNKRLLILARFFLRVDDVILRINDTRVYIEFEENKIIREYKSFEGTYDTIISKAKMSPGYSRDPKAALRDTNWVTQNIPLVNRECEVLILGKSHTDSK